MTGPISISDPADPRVAGYRLIADRRRPAGKVVVEGPAACARLLGRLGVIESLLTLEGRSVDVPDGIEWYSVTREVMIRVVGHDLHRGVLAIAHQPPPVALPAILAADRVVAVEGVNDSENLGAIIRTGVGLGFSSLLLDPTTTDPWYRRCVRVSMGHGFDAVFHRSSNWPETLGGLRAAGLTLVALTPGGSTNLADWIPPSRVVLLVGAEGPGLSAETIAMADVRVTIPMQPPVDSLNVSHALAIAAHHVSQAHRVPGVKPSTDLLSLPS